MEDWERRRDTPKAQIPPCGRCGGPQNYCGLCGEFHCVDQDCGTAKVTPPPFADFIAL